MYKDIIVNRIGKSKHSFMITNKIVREIYPNTNYKILLQNLIPLPKYENIQYDIKYNYKESVPKFIDIPCVWLNDKKIKESDNNILGDFGTLITNSEIKVPINVATYHNVKYYNAELYNIYDTIEFRCNEPLILTHMYIGNDYVKDYLEDEKMGGGQYLEIHDRPHFHASLTSDIKGYYLLGKYFRNHLRLSAFLIPYHKALYTPSFVIHSDSNLIGNWLVAYSKTDNYSTVLLKDDKYKMTKIRFE